LARLSKDWAADFIEFGRPFNTPQLFLEWGAIWQLSTAVGRQVGSRLRGQLLTPNMFIALLAGPGAGKSQAISAMRQIILPACNLSLIPASVTRAGLQDYMQENLQKRTGPDGTLMLSNECIALSEEMQGILPEHDIGHLTLYNELYDVRTVYKARTRSSGEINLQSPYCSIITGAQPAFLASTLPEQAWGMGFMSRLIMVFEAARKRTSAFEHDDVDRKLQTRLITDLREISKLYGYFKWNKDAKALYETWWVEKGGPPIPAAKRLAMGYNSRRDLHFFKVAMAFSLSRSNELEVTGDDAQRAIALLIKTEDRMKHIFNEMSQAGATMAIADILETVKSDCMDGKLVEEGRLTHMLLQRFPATQVRALIDNMIRSGALKQVGGVNGPGGVGFRKFAPGDKISAM
jgi:hypothetical protein